jgi:hypothetical protein
LNFCKDCVHRRGTDCTQDPRGFEFDLVTGDRTGQLFYACDITRRHESWARKPDCERFLQIGGPEEPSAPEQVTGKGRNNVKYVVLWLLVAGCALVALLIWLTVNDALSKHWVEK